MTTFKKQAKQKQHPVEPNLYPAVSSNAGETQRCLSELFYCWSWRKTWCIKPFLSYFECKTPLSLNIHMLSAPPQSSAVLVGLPATLWHKPGDLWWSNDRCEHVFGLSRCSYGPFIFASVLGGGRLRQAEGEGGTFAGRQDGELAGVDGRWRRLGEGHFWASLLALVFHCYLLSSIRRSSLRCSLAGVQEVLKRQR